MPGGMVRALDRQRDRGAGATFFRPYSGTVVDWVVTGSTGTSRSDPRTIAQSPPPRRPPGLARDVRSVPFTPHCPATGQGDRRGHA